MQESEVYTIHSASTGDYREKGSRFLAFLLPATSRDEGDAALLQIKKQYHDARHACYAWRMDGNEYSCDDGEPAHSAGSPILRQLVSARLQNAILIVVRYFGGTKLGIPGLIRAYSTAAADAIHNAELSVFVKTINFTLIFPYEETAAVKQLVNAYQLIEQNAEYAQKCSVTYMVAEHLWTKLQQNMGSLPHIECVVKTIMEV